MIAGRTKIGILLRDHDPFQFWAWASTDNSGCILWNGCVSPEGYGRYLQKGKAMYAHRIAYTRSVGPIPTNKVIDHLCRNRRCINPAHLEAVKQRVNIMRGTGTAARHAVSEYCKAGHPFDLFAVNRKDVRGRICVLCVAIRNRAFYLKRKGAKCDA